jgi:hypothetical protein
VLTLPPLSTLFLIPEDIDEPSDEDIAKERDAIASERLAKEERLAKMEDALSERDNHDDSLQGKG